jgi:lipoprotein-anchoring transpeptidase ErfK/SrfK
MDKINRRDFLKMGGIALINLALSKVPVYASPSDYENFFAPPTSLGRIAAWGGRAVRALPSATARWVEEKSYDDIIPLYAAVTGEAPWPSNPVWYQTKGGFIHSGYVQPVDNQPSSELVSDIPEPGFWAQVCIPIAEARWTPGSLSVARKLYYGTVYRVIAAEQDTAGAWWYRLQEGISDGAPGPYILAASVRRIPIEELVVISPGNPEKWIQIDRASQTLICYENNAAVFHTPVATGLSGTPTPRGEFQVLYKRHTRRMIGGSDTDRYDLPGVAFPTYFTHSGVAIHGTYWHNDYGRPHSHGCVNVSHQAAQWIFRWVEPIAPYETYTQEADVSKSGTRIVVC